jgi:hypothetical protein
LDGVEQSKGIFAAGNGFVGTYMGLYAGSNGRPSTNQADFDWFEYRGEGE